MESDLLQKLQQLIDERKNGYQNIGYTSRPGREEELKRFMELPEDPAIGQAKAALENADFSSGENQSEDIPGMENEEEMPHEGFIESSVKKLKIAPMNIKNMSISDRRKRKAALMQELGIRK